MKFWSGKNEKGIETVVKELTDELTEENYNFDTDELKETRDVHDTLSSRSSETTAITGLPRKSLIKPRRSLAAGARPSLVRSLSRRLSLSSAARTGALNYEWVTTYPRINMSVKWYTKLFFFFVDMCACNAFLLGESNGASAGSLHNFKFRLGVNLLEFKKDGVVPDSVQKQGIIAPLRGIIKAS